MGERRLAGRGGRLQDQGTLARLALTLLFAFTLAVDPARAAAISVHFERYGAAIEAPADWTAMEPSPDGAFAGAISREGAVVVGLGPMEGGAPDETAAAFFRTIQAEPQGGSQAVVVAGRQGWTYSARGAPGGRPAEIRVTVAPIDGRVGLLVVATLFERVSRESHGRTLAIAATARLTGAAAAAAAGRT